MNTTAVRTFNPQSVYQTGCIRSSWLPQLYTFQTDIAFIFFETQILIIFVLTQILHHSLFKHLGLPPLASQMVAGILLSPEVFFGKLGLWRGIHYIIFPRISAQVWKTLVNMGYILSAFIVAVKTDMSMIMKNGKKPFVIGLAVHLIPGCTTRLVSYIYGHTLLVDNDTQILDLATTSSVVVFTTFPVVAILLSDLKLLNSELGRLALSSAIISEIGSITIRIGLNAKSVWTSTYNATLVFSYLFAIFGLTLFAIFIVRPAMNYIVRQTPKGKPVKHSFVLLAFVLMLMGGLVTRVNNKFVNLGSYIIGLAIPEGAPLGSAIVHKYEALIMGVLMPVFISATTMKADVFKIELRSKLGIGHLIVTMTAFSTKIFSCLACGHYYDMPFKDSIALAAIMCSKGIIDVASYSSFNDSMMMTDKTFSYLILVAAITAFTTPVLIKLLYDPLRKYAGYERRDVINCKPDTPLKILACITRTDNVSTIANLLGVSRISRDNQMTVDVLHLIKLVGRSQPIFISHDLQTKKAFSISYSDEIIWDLKFQITDNMEGLLTHYYTAISPTSAMHEDICTLALDNLTSLIILPFHRKLGLDGSIDFEDYMQRTLNISVLERAPCSVGILIDRGFSNFKANIDQDVLVAVIFIGGKDDREAIAYARRISKGQNIQVSVIQLVALGEDHRKMSLLDSIVISRMQDHNSCNTNMKLVRMVVKDGPETARKLGSIAKDYDLIIVGRRYNVDCTQTSGLKEWSEVPEIGILGELLASRDLHCRASTLVVQQQKQWVGDQRATLID